MQIYVVAHTTQADYGVFAFTFAIYSIVESIATGFSADHAMQRLGKNSIQRSIKDQAVNFASLIIYDINFYLIVAGFCTMAGIFMSFLKNFNIYIWLILCFSLVFQIGYSAVKNLLIVYNLIEVQTRYEMECVALILILSILGTWMSGIEGYALSISIYQLFKLLLGITKIKSLGLSWKHIKPHLSLSNYNLNTSARIAFTAFTRNGLSNLYNQLDILLLGVLTGNQSFLANYKVAKTLSGLPTKVVYPVWAALRGRMVQAYYANDFTRLRMLVMRPLFVFAGLFILLFLAALIVAPYLIPFIYGPEYVGVTQVFLILLVGTLVWQMSNNWFNFWVIMAGQSRAYIMILIIQIGVLCASLLWMQNIQNTGLFAYWVTASCITGGALQFIYFFTFKHKISTSTG